MGFSRQVYRNGLPFSSPGDLPNPGIEPGSPTLRADASPSEPAGKPGGAIEIKGTASNILAWKIPQMEEPGGLQSMGSPRVGHDWHFHIWSVRLCEVAEVIGIRKK